MKKMKKVLSLVLAMVMILSLGTTSVQAAGRGQDGWSDVTYGASESVAETPAEAPAEEPAVPAEESEEPAAPAEEPSVPAEEPAEEPAAPAEEPAAPAEEVAAFPAVTLAGATENGVAVRVESPEGALPEGAYMTLKDVSVEEVKSKISGEIEGTILTAVDITFLDSADNEIQPNGSVAVSIKAPELAAANAANLNILHINEEKAEAEELTEAENAVQVNAADANAVAFENDAFSIYAVVERGEYARLKVIFNANGKQTTMYVKQKDITDGNLNQVLYDPGVPVQDGKIFLGWTDNQNWTSLSLEELKDNAKTIDDVRSDVTATLNAGITDGQSVNYYPIMVNIFELYYQDEEENTFKTESLLSVTGAATTTVDLAYTLTGGTATQNFIGWKVKGTDEPVYPNGSSIEIESDTILVPAIGDGRWLWFDSNAGGAGVSEASYTDPQFVAADNTPTEPAAPTRPGYTFDGWFDAPEGGNAYDFSKKLSEYTPDSVGYVWAYAHWTAKQDATYKVVIWAQKVTDDKDAADDAKTYDYIETYTVSGAVAGTILDETELRKSSNNYFEKDNAYFGANDLDNGSKAFEYARIKVERGIGNDGNGVNPDDSTVVNIYYDPAPQYIWTDRTSAVQNSTSNRFAVSAVEQANASTINNASAGTSFTRINTSTMVFQSGSQGSQFYARVGSSAELAACYVLQNYACTVQATGEDYTGIIYKKSTKPAVMTGLYGQNLSQYGYSWPRPSSGGTWDGIAFLDTFTGSFFGGDAFGETPNSILLTKDSQATNLTMIFYLQDKDNPDQYNEVDRAGYALNNVEGGKVKITERILGGTSKDYSWSTSDSIPTDSASWHVEIDNNGRTEFSRTDAGGDSYTYIHIRYNSLTNNIIFMQGSDELKTVGPVRYEESLAGYENEAPDESEVTVGDDEFFAGWFEDPEGVQRVNWDKLTMPLGNKIIYAVVRHSQYHVYIDMDGGTLPNAQRNQFMEVWGRTIDKTNFMNATKTDAQGNRYTLVGYYWDEAMTKPWNFDIPLSEEYLWRKYDDSHGEDPYRTSDFFGPGNDDSGYPQCVGIFRLWAKWKNDSILSKGGLNIRYRNPEASENLYVDPMHYADMSDVIAAQAPEETNWPAGKRFDGWQLTEGKVYQPGDVFVADSDDAVIENDKYWITLTAVYVDKENRTPTHITWYRNDGSSGDDRIVATSNDQGINEPWDIYGKKEGGGYNLPAYIGKEGDNPANYRFLGWARANERATDGETINYTTDSTDLFLAYDYENDQYTYTKADGTIGVAEQVAADEVLPYDGLYAIIFMYLLTCIDDTYYSEAGYVIKKTDEQKATIVTTFSYQNDGSTKKTKVKAENLIEQRGYIGVVNANDNIRHN